MLYSIINAKIICHSKKIIKCGFIKVNDKKIIEVGDMENFSEFGKIYDKKNLVIIPGLVDAHTHIGIIGDSTGFESNDLNEMTDPTTPQLRAIDAVNPMDICFHDAYTAGITTIVTGPGSANPISGQMIAMKTYGMQIDKMVLKAPCAIKFAFGENPKSAYHLKNQAPETRMATAAIIREMLIKAKIYAEALEKSKNGKEKTPDFDFKCESLLPLLRGEIRAHFHAHRADDIFTAIRIAKEFNLKYVIVHCTDGYLMPSELKELAGFNAFIGPIISDRSKPELRNLSLKNVKILSENNIDISIITDHSEVPIEYLRLSVMLCIKSGLDKEKAIDLVTINPAKALGLDKKIGSIECGKDADFVVLDGEPFEFNSNVLEVYINGNKIYEEKCNENY